jgi:hypothetical protein
MSYFSCALITSCEQVLSIGVQFKFHQGLLTA